MSRDARRRDPGPSPIIGMAGRFPGARDVDEFWRNLRGGVESIRFFTDERAGRGRRRPDADSRASRLRAARGVLEDVRICSTRRSSAITPREAELMDPQQRLFLECAWEALEHAGYDPERYAGADRRLRRARASTPTRSALSRAAGSASTRSAPSRSMLGNDKDYLADARRRTS